MPRRKKVLDPGNLPEPRAKKSREDRAWEKVFWTKMNSLCLKCEKSCKQSSKVKILVCPDYKKT